MPASHKPPLLKWPEIFVFALLACMMVMGVVANGRTVAEGLVAVVLGAWLVVCAGLWQWTLRRVPAKCSRWQRVTCGLVFVGWLVVVGGAVWWCGVERVQQHQPHEVPAPLRVIDPQEPDALPPR